MDQLLDVTAVRVKPDYRLELQFENGERRLFDMSPYMNKKPFIHLKNPGIVCVCFHRLRYSGLAGRHRYCTRNAV
jgi:hypothetical protein